MVVARRVEANTATQRRGAHDRVQAVLRQHPDPLRVAQRLRMTSAYPARRAQRSGLSHDILSWDSQSKMGMVRTTAFGFCLGLNAALTSVAPVGDVKLPLHQPLLEMSPVWCSDGVLYTQPHSRMHRHLRERGRGAPSRLLRFDPVRARLRLLFRHSGDGMEAQRQLLVNGAVRVEKDMGGVAVDAGEPSERYGHSRLLGDLADHRLGCGFADLEASAGQLPEAVIDPPDQQNFTGAIADRGERRRQHVARARRGRILVVLA